MKATSGHPPRPKRWISVLFFVSVALGAGSLVVAVVLAEIAKRTGREDFAEGWLPVLVLMILAGLGGMFILAGLSLIIGRDWRDSLIESGPAVFRIRIGPLPPWTFSVRFGKRWSTAAERPILFWFGWSVAILVGVGCLAFLVYCVIRLLTDSS